MLERLGKIVDEIAALQTKLILLVGEPGSGKTPLLVKLADSRGGQVLNVGVVLGKRLAALPHRQRPLKVNEELKALADDYVCEKDLVLLDNIELLFDQSLKLDPLELLKRHAHSTSRSCVAGRAARRTVELCRHGAFRISGLWPGWPCSVRD